MVTSNRPSADEFEDYASWISDWASSQRHLRAHKLTFAPQVDDTEGINTQDFIHTVNAVLSIYDRSDHTDLWSPGTFAFVSAPAVNSDGGNATLAMSAVVSQTMGAYQCDQAVQQSLDGLAKHGITGLAAIAKFQWLAVAQPGPAWHDEIYDLNITLVNPLAFAVGVRISKAKDAGWHCPSFDGAYPTTAHLLYHTMYSPVFKQDMDFYNQWNNIFNR
ncbi:MAG: hypothetical protein ACO3O3_08630 [Ilumatobacteraceae bacterium]